MREIIRLMSPVFLIFVALILLGKRTFEEAQEGAFSIDNINRVVGLAGSLILVFPFFLKKQSLQVPFPLRWFALYIVICSISSLFYSEWVGYSFWKVVEILSALAVSIYVATLAKRNPRMAFVYYESCLNFFLLMMVVAVIGAVVNPAAAITPPVSERTIDALGEPVLPYQLRGILFIINPNSLGVMGAILTFVYLVRVINGARGARPYLVLPLSFCVLVAAQSRTAWAGFFVAFFWYALFSANPSMRTRLGLWGLSTVGLLGGLGVFIAYLTRGFSIEQLQGLSGRAVWWDVAWSRFAQSGPDEQLFGLGFMTANRTITIQEIGYSVTTLHSDYADALISTGYLGLCLIILCLASSWLQLWPMRRCSGYLVSEIIGTSLILTVRTFTGTTISIFNFFLVIFFAIVVLSGVLKRLPAEALAKR